MASSSSMPAPAAPATSTTTTPTIHTYHCLCRTLILGTSANIRSLSQRAAPVKDQARILSLPLPLHGSTADSTEGAGPPVSRFPGLIRDREPVIVQREDGYEKRWLWRCVRCGLLVAYVLDGRERLERREGVKGGGAGAVDADKGGGEGEGPVATEVVYLLDKGLLETEELRKMVTKGR